MQEEYTLSTKEAAQLLGLKENTLRIWRMHKKNLEFKRTIKGVKYRAIDIQEFIEQNTHIVSINDNI